MAACPASTHAHLGRHFPNTVGGGDYTWDLAFAGARTVPAVGRSTARSPGTPTCSIQLVTRTDAVQFESTNVHIAERDDHRLRQAHAVPRSRARATPPDKAREFDRVLTGMPRYIDAIRNWAYPPRRRRLHDRAAAVDARVGAGVPGRLGLRVDYMVSPYHWGYVDPWFDPESPHRVVAPGVAHVYCPAAATILGW